MTLAKEHFFLCVDAQCVPRATLTVAEDAFKKEVYDRKKNIFFSTWCWVKYHLSQSIKQTNPGMDLFLLFNNHSLKQVFLIFDKVQENKHETISWNPYLFKWLEPKTFGSWSRCEFLEIYARI